MVAGTRKGSIPAPRVKGQGYRHINEFWIQDGIFGEETIIADILEKEKKCWDIMYSSTYGLPTGAPHTK